jgi:hypothetical protein
MIGTNRPNPRTKAVARKLGLMMIAAIAGIK